MEALINIKDPNFEIILSRQANSDTKMMLSTIAIPLEDIYQMIQQALIEKSKMIPVRFNEALDEDDFFNTLELRKLNDKISIALITNKEGLYFELGNEVLNSGIVYGPIRFKTILKIIDFNWPVEVYLPISCRENNEEALEEDDPLNEKELRNNFKKLSREDQEQLMKTLEEQEKRGEI
jgi:hypothetical protein